MLRITQVSSSGMTGPTSGDGSATLHDAYETIDSFSVDIKFEGAYLDATDPLGLTYVYSNATNITSSYNFGQYGITMSKPNAYTVRLTGPATNVFTDQYYKFVLPDLSQQILPADTTVEFLSMVRYQKPSNISTTLSYPFTVTIPASYGSGSTTNESATISHTLYWSISVARANISRLKTQGTR